MRPPCSPELQNDLPRLRVLIPNLRGLELSLAHGIRNVLVTIAATDSFNRRNVNRSVDESLDEISHIVELAGERACAVDVAVSASLAVAGGRSRAGSGCRTVR